MGPHNALLGATTGHSMSPKGQGPRGRAPGANAHRHGRRRGRSQIMHPCRMLVALTGSGKEAVRCIAEANYEIIRLLRRQAGA
jgi:hypothetical protein